MHITYIANTIIHVLQYIEYNVLNTMHEIHGIENKAYNTRKPI